MIWYTRYKREVWDVQCSMSRPMSKCALPSTPSAMTIGLLACFSSTERMFCTAFGDIVSRATWQDDDRTQKLRVTNNSTGTTSLIDNLASTLQHASSK